MTNYGTAPQPAAPQPAAPRPPVTPERRAQVLGYVAGGLGVASFIWGFLDWYSGGTGGYSVYGGGATAAVSLALVAGLIAAGRAFENRAPTIEPAAISLAGLLVVFAVLVGKGSSDSLSSVDVEVGLILQLITAIAQAGILIYAWMGATGRLPAPRPHPVPPAQPAQQWQQPPPGYQAPPPGYQQPPPPQGWQPPPNS